MRSRAATAVKRGLLGLALVAVTLLTGRIVQSELGPPLKPWHTYVPPEPRAEEIDRLDWTGYLATEAKLFELVRTEVTLKLDPEDQVAADRYFEGSPVNPARFAQDWNRSYVLTPDGPPRGAAVLLHGLTDSPYSLRHFARLYRDRGYVAVPSSTTRSPLAPPVSHTHSRSPCGSGSSARPATDGSPGFPRS
jgi:hypothetical protein